MDPPALAFAGGGATLYRRAKEETMPTCKECGEDVDQLVSVKIDGKAKKLCEDCADAAKEGAAVAEESEAVVQRRMEYKGRR